MGLQTGHYLVLHECQRTVSCQRIGMLAGALVLKRCRRSKSCSFVARSR